MPPQHTKGVRQAIFIIQLFFELNIEFTKTEAKFFIKTEAELKKEAEPKTKAELKTEAEPCLEVPLLLPFSTT